MSYISQCKINLSKSIANKEEIKNIVTHYEELHIENTENKNKYNKLVNRFKELQKAYSDLRYVKSLTFILLYL
jgi:predicted nuclease with TOPRIM domain